MAQANSESVRETVRFSRHPGPRGGAGADFRSAPDARSGLCRLGGFATAARFTAASACPTSARPGPPGSERRAMPGTFSGGFRLPVGRHMGRSIESQRVPIRRPYSGHTLTIRLYRLRTQDAPAVPAQCPCSRLLQRPINGTGRLPLYYSGPCRPRSWRAPLRSSGAFAGGPRPRARLPHTSRPPYPLPILSLSPPETHRRL
jgi:hypothetical protein